MTEAEEADLQALGSDLAAAAQSPWEPACVARAFGSPRPCTVVFSMQTWIDLSRENSPLLLGALPETLDELEAAMDCFGLAADTLTPEEMADVARVLLRTVNEAFAMSLPMQPPKVGEPLADEGFGGWLPIFAGLIRQCGFDRLGALACPVGQAFSIFAASRHNEGWRTAGTPYALRDVATLEGA